jgi:hypothetical protein
VIPRYTVEESNHLAEMRLLLMVLQTASIFEKHSESSLKALYHLPLPILSFSFLSFNFLPLSSLFHSSLLHSYLILPLTFSYLFFYSIPSPAEASPYPFNKEGKFLYKASDWKAVPRGFPGDPPEIALIGRSVGAMEYA